MQSFTRILTLAIAFIISSYFNSYSQKPLEAGFDTAYTREAMIKLASPEFAGRGYINDGDKKASDYISKEFKNAGAQYFQGAAYQGFTYPVNTFPGTILLRMCERELIPGQDYLVHPGSPSLSGEYSLIKGNKNDNGFVLISESDLNSGMNTQSLDSLVNLYDKAQGFVMIKERKLTWWVSRTRIDKPVIMVSNETDLSGCESISIQIKSEFISHETGNVIGYMPGTDHPERFIVITGHYDHLGMMGPETIFNGANDNASGIAVMLTLARYYGIPDNRPSCSIVFMAFAGEEAGLKGSEYYVDNPLFPLDSIRFLLNLDLMGTGEEGITVVNGSVHNDEFELLSALNDSLSSFSYIGKRGKAANSDHHHFSEMGVPAFFIYTMGPRKAYHDIYDIAETVQLPKILESLQLINSFINRICKEDQR